MWHPDLQRKEHFGEYSLYTGINDLWRVILLIAIDIKFYEGMNIRNTEHGTLLLRMTNAFISVLYQYCLSTAQPFNFYSKINSSAWKLMAGILSTSK